MSVTNCTTLKCFFCAAIAGVFLLCCASTRSAVGHTRLFACCLANDDPKAFMGGSSIGAGLWISDDSGVVWRQIGWKHVKCYSVAIADSSSGKTMYLACGNGLMRTTDGGEHWRMTTDWRISEVLDVAVEGAKQERITIATATGLWKSIDSGEHWEAFGERRYYQHLFHDKRRQAITTENSVLASDSTVLQITENGAILKDGKQIVRAYASRGKLWEVASAGDKIFLGGERGVYELDNENVPHLLPGSPRNAHSLMVLHGTLVVASLSGGVYRCDLRTEKRHFKRSGLDTLQVWSLKSEIIQ